MEDETPIPGNIGPSLEQKLSQLDDHLEPLTDTKEEEPKVEIEEEPATAEEKPEGEAAETNGDAEAESDDEGYTIDGDEEDATDGVVETPVGDVPKSELTPELQYIMDNIKPIAVRGYVGDSDKVETFNVLDPSQLPAGFKFVDDRDRALVTKAFAMLENQAEKLQGDFRNQSTQKAARDFKEREDNADRADIGKLQREGELPKFKAEPGSRDFEADPATVLIQEVIDFKEKTNQRYTEEYNAGRPYKHIGFEEAYAMYKRTNPSRDPAEVAEDADRNKLAKRTASTRSTAETAKSKTPVRMSSRGLDDFINSLDW